MASDNASSATQDLLAAPNGMAQTPVTAMPVIPAPVTASGAQPQAELGLQAYDPAESFIGTCPDCGSQLEMAEGCAKCHVCGFSECG